MVVVVTEFTDTVLPSSHWFSFLSFYADDRTSQWILILIHQKRQTQCQFSSWRQRERERVETTANREKKKRTRKRTSNQFNFTQFHVSFEVEVEVARARARIAKRGTPQKHRWALWVCISVFALAHVWHSYNFMNSNSFVIGVIRGNFVQHKIAFEKPAKKKKKNEKAEYFVSNEELQRQRVHRCHYYFQRISH